MTVSGCAVRARRRPPSPPAHRGIGPGSRTTGASARSWGRPPAWVAARRGWPGPRAGSCPRPVGSSTTPAPLHLLPGRQRLGLVRDAGWMGSRMPMGQRREVPCAILPGDAQRLETERRRPDTPSPERGRRRPGRPRRRQRAGPRRPEASAPRAFPPRRRGRWVQWTDGGGAAHLRALTVERSEAIELARPAPGRGPLERDGRGPRA